MNTAGSRRATATNWPPRMLVTDSPPISMLPAHYRMLVDVTETRKRMLTPRAIAS